MIEPPKRGWSQDHPLFASVSVDRREIRDDFSSVRLEERRQHDLLAECALILVDREAWSVRRDLEQNSVRLTEVQASKPIAVDLPTVRNTHRIESLGPRVVILIGRSKGDVVD